MLLASARWFDVGGFEEELRGGDEIAIFLSAAGLISINGGQKLSGLSLSAPIFNGEPGLLAGFFQITSLPCCCGLVQIEVARVGPGGAAACRREAGYYHQYHHCACAIDDGAPRGNLWSHQSFIEKLETENE